MKKIEIYNYEDEPIYPVTGTGQVYNKKGEQLDDVLSKTVISKDIEESDEIGSEPELSTIARSLMNAMVINVKGYTILQSEWILNEETKLYEYNISDEYAKENSIASIYLNMENSIIASEIGLLSYTSTSEGNIKIFSKKIPSSNIECDYNLLTALDDVTDSPSSSQVTLELNSKMARIESAFSKLLSVKKNQVLDTNGWTLNSSTGLYEISIEDSNATLDSIVNVEILEDSKLIAINANVQDYTESYDGGFKLFSTYVPTSNINYNYIINNPYSV